MEIVEEKDARLVHVHQGVRQDEDGLDYREGVLEGGAPAKVRYDDGRQFRLNEGTLRHNTLHIVVTERDGSEHRAGGAYTI
jgi:hypothetical protein